MCIRDSLFLIVILAAFFLFFGGDDEEDLAATNDDPTVEPQDDSNGTETAIAPPPTQVGPNQVPVSLVVASPRCEGPDCIVSGPLNAVEPAAYQISVGGDPAPGFSVIVDGVPLDVPGAPFGFGGSPGRKQIQVMFDSGETLIFNQYAFVPPEPGTYLVPVSYTHLTLPTNREV